MQTLLLLLLIFALGVLVLAMLWFMRQYGFLFASPAQKQSHKNKILEYLRAHGQAQNHQLRAYVGCSAKSIVNYCDQLENEGKIRQIGKIGKYAHYTLNT